jgi:threonine dehydrogenase-like Zn-dependent dehydrogenase
VRALTVVPGSSGSATVRDVPEPVRGPGDLLVDGLAVGICGTDREIAAGEYGWAPPGEEHLVLGHESLGHYRAAADALARADRDWLAGLVTRRVPLASAADALRPDAEGVKTVVTLQD